MTSKIVIYYPFEGKSLSKKAMDKFSKTPSLIKEVSWPSKQVNVLRIETVDYSLRCRRVPESLRDVYVQFGKTLVVSFEELPVGETMEMPALTLTLDKAVIGLIGQSEETTCYKRFTQGWIKQDEEGVFQDFFSEDF